MRSKPLLALPARVGSAASMVVVLAALACQGSSTVSGPSTGTPSTSSANVLGSWSGSFVPDDPVRCTGSGATAVFQQNGNDITGTISTSECGVKGDFRGSMQGGMLLGRISMPGCTGGGVSGSMSGSELSLSIGDLTKPLVSGDTPVMTGGIVTLHR